MKQRRSTEGLGLAFLDIMSCGLGAIVLVFMLVKHNVDNSILETELLKSDLSRLNQKEASLRDEISQQADRKVKSETLIAALSARIARAKSSLEEAQRKLSEDQKSKGALEEVIKKIKIPKLPDAAEIEGQGEEQYLIGLRVEGKRIAVLLDSSASMTDEQLIEVIRRKNLSDREKQAGPKWRRAKRIVNWVLARLPNSSQVSVITYADKAKRLSTAPWVSASDQSGLKDIQSRLDKHVPGGATNLQAGLSKISASGATDIYVITDGLPTAGDSTYKSLNPFADCSALWGSSSRISGTCRLKLFAHTVNVSGMRSVKVNVIMLPLEGDPTAAFAFWKWSSQTKGLLISPATEWP